MRTTIAIMLLLASVPQAPRPPFKKLYELPAKAQIESRVVSGDTVFFGTFESYGAFNLNTGKMLWETGFSDPHFGADVAFDGSTLFVSIGNGKLLACDARSGKEAWSLPRKGYSGPMSMKSDVLFCELQDGVLTALDTKSRKSRWSVNLEPKPISKQDMRDIGASVAPLIVGDRVVVATFAGDVMCLDERTGKTYWRQPILAGSLQSAWATGMRSDRGSLYISTNFGQLIALNLLSGKQRWKFASQGGLLGAPVVYGDAVFFSNGAAELYAVNASDGTIKWQHTLSRHPEPTLSPVVVERGVIIGTAESRLFAFDPTGKKQWEFDTEERLFGSPVDILKDGVLLDDAQHFYRYVMGNPPALPTSITARRALAHDLTRRFDKLTKDEKRQLRDLHDEAFDALLPLVKERLARYIALEKNRKAELDDYSRFSDAMDAIAEVSRAQHTPTIIALLKGTEITRDNSARQTIFELLADKADERALPLFLDELRKGPKAAGYNPGLRLVTKSSHQKAVQFLIDQIADPKANETIRHEAFANLARTGGEAGLKAVLASKDKQRTIPNLMQRIGLEGLGTRASPAKAAVSHQRFFGTQLLATKKDKEGRLCGLLVTRLLGSDDDLWIARHDGKRWQNPVFTGMRHITLGKRDWFASYVGNATLTRDNDGDGWSDPVERRLGTDSNKADTDGDGIKDSRDRNPLAAPHALTEEEQVLATAFEARFRFVGGRDVPCLVTLPTGIRPLELTGWDSIIISVQERRKMQLSSVAGHGVAVVSFRPPDTNFDREAVRRRWKEGEFILWNPTRTQAKVHLVTYYGGLDATGYDIELRKLRGQWIVIRMNMVWIS